MRYPRLKDLYRLCLEVKKGISDEYRAFEDDDCPGIQLTVGANETGHWSWQTGDNSYTGSAYLYPFWGVVGVYRNSNCMDLARDIKRDIEDQIAS